MVCYLSSPDFDTQTAFIVENGDRKGIGDCQRNTQSLLSSFTGYAGDGQGLFQVIPGINSISSCSRWWFVGVNLTCIDSSYSSHLWYLINGWMVHGHMESWHGMQLSSKYKGNEVSTFIIHFLLPHNSCLIYDKQEQPDQNVCNASKVPTTGSGKWLPCTC